MFEDFRREKIAIDDIEINLVVGGSGPPLLLLHGSSLHLFIPQRQSSL